MPGEGPDGAEAPRRFPDRLAKNRPAMTIIAAILLIAPVAIGTVHPVVQLPIFLAAALAAALYAPRIAVESRGLLQHPLVMPLGLAAIFTTLQLIPVPAAVIGLLSPHTGELLANTPVGERAHSLSLDPYSGVVELAKIACYFCFLLAVSLYTEREHRRFRVLAYVVAVTTLVAVIGFVQSIATPDHVAFVLFRPNWRQAIARGTFVNPNHFGALLCVSLPCTIAIAWSRSRWRLLATVALIIQNTALILTVARGAIFAGFLGQALTVIFLIVRQARSHAGQRGSRVWRRGVYFLLIGLVSVAIPVGVFSEQISNKLVNRTLEDLSSSTNFGHAELIKSAVSIVRLYPVTGVGRGAVAHVYPRVSGSGGQFTVPWVESFFLQALVDYGAILGTLFLASLVWAARKLWLYARNDALGIGAFFGLLALMLGDMVNFALEIPGVALPALAVAATLRDPARRIPSASPRLRWFAVIVPVLAAAVGIAAFFMPTFDEEEKSVAALAGDKGVNQGTITTEATGAWRRHPADYVFPLIVADSLARRGQPEAFAWINKGLRLNPFSTHAHVLAADVLLASGRRSQGLLEYRLAASMAADPQVIWDHAYRKLGSIDLLQRTVPENRRAIEIFVSWLRTAGKESEVAQQYVALLAIQPDHAVALAYSSQDALSRKDTAGALALAERYRKLRPREDDSAALLFRALLAVGKLDRAAQVLEENQNLPDGKAFGLQLGEALIDSDNVATARIHLDRVEARYNLSPADVRRLHQLRARIEEKAGNLNRSQWERERALHP